MIILYILIPISLILLLISVLTFCWAVKHRQYEDLEYEAKRILLDDEFNRHRGDDE